jgi:hypothetical protein
MLPDEIKELTGFDGPKNFDLARGIEIGKAVAGFFGEHFQSGNVRRLHPGFIGCQIEVDKPGSSGFTGARRIVGRDDLRYNGFDYPCLLGG